MTRERERERERKFIILRPKLTLRPVGFSSVVFFSIFLSSCRVIVSVRVRVRCVYVSVRAG